MFRKVRFHSVILLAVLVLLVIVSLLMVIKPGASIFYYKSTIQNELLKYDKRNAYTYSMSVNTLFDPARGILLYEDGQPLKLSASEIGVIRSDGRYYLSTQEDGKYSLIFSPFDNSDPRTNGRKYIIYQQLVFVSREMGIRYLLFLIILSLLVGIAISKGRLTRETDTIKVTDWRTLYPLTILLIYLYVFMEWLFLITKPSFLDVMSFPEKVSIFFQTGFIISLLGIGLLIILTALDFLFVRLKLPRIANIFLIAVPASIITGLIFLLIDNFTYTLFKFGSFSTKGISQGVYGFVLILLFVYVHERLMGLLVFKKDSYVKWQPSKLLYLFSGGLFIASVLLVIMGVRSTVNMDLIKEKAVRVQPTMPRPHILLIGSDGLLADNMSVYGYKRDTTPRIRELAIRSLVAENAFSNSAHSSGSIVSIFTSKLATETRVLYPPDILKGSDAFQHLPGILKREGYRTEEIGVRYFIDSSTLNLINAFDIVNRRTVDNGNTVKFIRDFGLYDTAYMLSLLTGRIQDRINHIFYLRTMDNPFTLVTEPVVEQVVQDRARVDHLLDLLSDTDEPLFVHMHLMGTHGPKFYPENRIFSEGQEQNDNWMVDFYDDAILTFDSYVGEVVDTLSDEGMLDDIVIIIYSDHGQEYSVNKRIPLIFYFPIDTAQGSIKANVQHLDIAPTILDFLGLAQPGWMRGESLLKNNLDRNRLIFSVGTTLSLRDIGDGKLTLDEDRLVPPFNQFSNLYVINCQRWLQLSLGDSINIESSGDVVGHTSPCNDESLLTREEVVDSVIEHLYSAGFDISSLPQK